MIVRLNKGIKSYYAAPHTFTQQYPEQKVSAKLGSYLLKTGYFKEIGEPEDNTDDEEEIEVPVEEVGKEIGEPEADVDNKEEKPKKKSTKKDK